MSLNQWHTNDKPFDSFKLELPPERYREFLSWHDATIHKMLVDVSGLHTLPLTYEDLTEDWIGSVGKVCQFLEVTPMPLQPE
jgi:hypothetical protein